MRRSAVLVVSSVALVLAFAGTGRSKKPKPQPCPGGRYLVSGSALVTGDTSGPIEPVVIGGAVISIGNACAPVHAKLKATAHGTTVQATWPSCTGLKGKVQLKGSLDTTCTTLNGKLTAKKSKLKQPFVARASRCGDEIFDAGGGEQCDGAPCASGGACTADCTCAPPPTSTTTTATTTTLAQATTTTIAGQLDCTMTPKSCALLGTDVDCCGNDVVDPGEECDSGGHNTADCSANCLRPRCGNCNVDPGETCDDGNAVDIDPKLACPASCVIQSCTVDTGTHQALSLHLTAPPADVPVGGLTVVLDYPEGNVRMPVVMAPDGVLATPSDHDWAMRLVLLDSTFGNGIPANGAGPMAQATFDGCEGAALPAAADYTCTITDASDELGAGLDTSTPGWACAVTVP